MLSLCHEDISPKIVTVKIITSLKSEDNRNGTSLEDIVQHLPPFARTLLVALVLQFSVEKAPFSLTEMIDCSNTYLEQLHMDHLHSSQVTNLAEYLLEQKLLECRYVGKAKEKKFEVKITIDQMLQFESWLDKCHFNELERTSKALNSRI